MKKYISLFRMRFLAGMQYRAAALAGIATQFAWGFLNILLYKAFYEANPAAFPMKMEELSAYIWLRQAFLALFATWYYDKDILAMISDGSIAYELARPVDLYTIWFMRTASVRISRAVLRCLPILVIAFIVPAPYGMMLPKDLLSAAAFVFSMALSLVCVCAFGLIVYVMCCHTINSLGVRIVMSNLSDFLSGGIIPMPFMPDALRKIAEYSPFGAMENLPFRIYSGNIAGMEMWQFLLLQIFWCAALILAGKVWMNLSLKKIVIQGG